MSRRATPPPQVHWLVLVVIGIVVFSLLAVAELISGQHGEGPGSPTSGATTGVPAAVRVGGPIVNAVTRQPGLHAPSRTVVLTFDDGPSSYTPHVLDVLEHYRVPGTFFVIGENIAGRTDLLRRMVTDGDEIGVHTFTHPDLGSVSSWREHLELQTTQVAIASATGYFTDLMRLPYSSTPSAINADQWRAIERAGHYRVVFADLDTRDWARPGVARIVDAATPSSTAGVVVMMHDGGGDRSQTVAALRILIPRLLADGWRFDTVSHAIGVSSPWVPASTVQRLRGSLTLGTLVAARWLITGLTILFILVGVLAVLRALVLLLFARHHARHHARLPRPIADQTPPISVIVPAYNEATGIQACIRSIAACDYPDVEIIVVDDGSTDGTAELARALDLPLVTVLQQANAGKPAALNAGIAAARHELIVMVDGDTVFEPDSLRQIVAPFAEPTVGAVSGNAKVGNRGRLIGRWQHIEYVIGFNFDRRMFDVLQCMPTVPGAIGAFRRRALETAGGVSDDTLAEDTDLTMSIIRAGWQVVYAPAARAWTEAPANLSALWRQRYRWCYGTLQAMWKHRGSVFARGAAGRLGRRGLPYLFVFQVLLPLLAPVVDLATVAGVVTGHGRELALTWLAFLALQLMTAWYGFRLDHESPRVLWALPLQQVVYRQLMYLVVIQSMASALYGVRLRWHKLERTGRLDHAPALPAETPSN